MLTFEPRQSNLTLVPRTFLSVVISSARLTRGGGGVHAKLALSIRVSDIHEHMAQERTS